MNPEEGAIRVTTTFLGCPICTYRVIDQNVALYADKKWNDVEDLSRSVELKITDSPGSFPPAQDGVYRAEKKERSCASISNFSYGPGGQTLFQVFPSRRGKTGSVQGVRLGSVQGVRLCFRFFRRGEVKPEANEALQRTAFGRR